MHQIPAGNPLDQGCPTSSTLACVGMIPILNTFEMYGAVHAYQDDSYTLMEARKTEARRAKMLKFCYGPTAT